VSAGAARLVWLLVLAAIATGIWAGAWLFALWSAAPIPAG
jgi:hypothetical protein